MNEAKKKKQARILRTASNQRNRVCKLDSMFQPLHFAENELPFVISGYSFEYRDAVYHDGLPAEAKVSFEDGVHMIVSDTAGLEAHRGLNRARFTISHEIGHALLHRDQMSGRTGDASRPRATNVFALTKSAEERKIPSHVVKQGIHRLDDAMEKEANAFAGALLIPIERINVSVDPRTLAEAYKTSVEAASWARKRVLQSWKYLPELWDV